MEIKTIEELACIPVENDDFAAASDQDEGDVIKIVCPMTMV